MKEVYFNSNSKSQVYSCITKNTTYYEGNDVDILSFDFKKIKEDTFKHLQKILIIHFVNFKYFSPENHYFVLKVLREQKFNL